MDELNIFVVFQGLLFPKLYTYEYWILVLNLQTP